MFADLDMTQQCGCRAPDIAQYGQFNPPAYVCSICGCSVTHLFDEGDMGSDAMKNPAELFWGVGRRPPLPSTPCRKMS